MGGLKFFFELFYILIMNAYLNDFRQAKSIRVLRPTLERLVQQRVITPDGRDWLLCALDPFHDYLHELAGYPDQDGSLTVVERFTDQTTVVFPDGLEQGETWDCLIFNPPVINFTEYQAPHWVREMGVVHEDVDNAGSVDHDTANAHGAATLYPLTIWRGISGTEFVPKVITENVASWPSINNHSGLQSIPETLQGKKMRLVGQGFEVHNTTPELYQGGTVTVGRVPQANERQVRVFRQHAGVAPDSIQVIQPIIVSNPPPGTSDEAIRYSDSQSWEAKHGCYAHCTQSGAENPITAGDQRTIFMRTQGDIGGVCLVGNQDPSTGSASGAVRACGIQNYCNTNMHFAFFHGLHKDTTLNVMNRAYVEYAPRVDDALLPLAKPSAEYDIHALQLYAAVVNHLPAAVMVEMNARGRFAKMIGGILTAAAPILGLTMGPEMAAAAVVGGTALEASGAAVARNAKNRPAAQTRSKKGPTTAVVTRRK